MSDREDEYESDGTAREGAGITEADMTRATRVLERKDKENEELKSKLADLQAKYNDLALRLPDRTPQFTVQQGPSTVGERSVPAAGRAPPPTGLTWSGGNAPIVIATKKPYAKIPNFTAKGGDIIVFLKKLDLYFTLQPMTDQDKIATMLSAMDETAFGICQHMSIPPAQRNDYQHWREAVKERFEPATSVQERRLQFRNTKQHEQEDLDTFYERLLLAASKAFPALNLNELDLQVSEQMVYGMLDPYLKQRLLETPPRDSREALVTAKRLLAAKRYSSNTSTTVVPAVTATTTAPTTSTSTTAETTTTNVLATAYSRGRPRGRGRARYRGRGGYGRQLPSRTSDGKPLCYRCGKPNHIAAHCRTNLTATTPPPYSSMRSASPSSNRSNERNQNSSFNINRDYQSRGSGDYADFQSNRPDSRRNDYERNNQQPAWSQNRRSGTPVKQLIGTIRDDGKNVNWHNMYLRGYVNGMLAYIMVDTGSVISMMSKNFYNWINEIQPVELKKHEGQIYGITSDCVDILGTVEVPIRLCNTDSNQERLQLTYTFIVCEGVATDCLIGLNFLEKYKVKIDVEACTLTLSDGMISSKHELVDKTYHNKPVSVFVAGQHVIPAKTQCFISCELNLEQCDPDEDWRNVQQVVFSPTQTMHEKYNLLLANCITSTSLSKINVHVANTSDHDVMLRSGLNCGIAEPCDDDYVTYSTYVTGERVVAEGEVECKPNEKHVTFRETVDMVDNQQVKIFSDQELEQTAAWIKTIGLDIDFTKFTPNQSKQIVQLIAEYKDIFAQHKHDYGLCTLPGCEHTIEIVPEAKPVRLPPHRATPPMHEVIEKETREMLQQGIIRESSGEWTSPVVMAKKKDGSWRFCVNYKKLNSITVADRYPLPKVEDCFDSLAGSCLYSTLDLAAGYWQIPMKEEDKVKTGFVNHLGTYEFERLPFGLTNSPSRFSRTMDILLKGLKWLTCLVYLDDVIAFSRTFSEHLLRLRAIFQRFRQAKLKLQPKKCHLLKPKIEFLGHEVSKNGISPMPAKVRAIKEFPRPTNIKTLQSFLGLASYYRKYYKQNFAVLAKPLYQLTEKSNRNTFQWRQEHEQAFQALKDAIVNDITLAYPNFSKIFVVQTDAAQFGIGACLMQQQDDDSLQPIAFASRTLSKREILYSTIEKETLAILYACETFYPYLYGKHFILQSDHKPITYLRVNQHKNPRLGRWLMKLQEMDFEIKHVPGVLNKVADALSRAPLPETRTERLECLVSGAKIEHMVAQFEAPITMDEIADAQYEDDTLQRFLNRDLNEHVPVTHTLRTLYRHINDIFEDEGILYFTEPNDERCKVVLPPVLHNVVLFELHNQPTSGHGGIQKVYKMFRERYYWPGMYGIVSNYVNKCQDCQLFKRAYINTKPELLPIYSNAAMELVQADCIGPMCTASNGSKYIFTIVDAFTRWASAYAVPNIQTATLIPCIEDWIANHGAMTSLLTDNAKDFTSNLFKAFTQAFNINVKHTTPYAPQTNGACERFNGTLIKIIQKYVSSTNKEWPELLPSALAAYRMSPHAGLDGMTPFEALYGRKPVLPCDIHLPTATAIPASTKEYKAEFQQRINNVQKYIQTMQRNEKQKMKERFDKLATKFRYNIGDKVYLNVLARKKGSCKKLEPLFKGPYVITERLGEVDYVIQLLNSRSKKEVVHQRRLKPAYIDESEDEEIFQSEEEKETDREENEIEHIEPVKQPSKTQLTREEPPTTETDSDSDEEYIIFSPAKTNNENKRVKIQTKELLQAQSNSQSACAPTREKNRQKVDNKDHANINKDVTQINEKETNKNHAIASTAKNIKSKPSTVEIAPGSDYNEGGAKLTKTTAQPEAHESHKTPTANDANYLPENSRQPEPSIETEQQAMPPLRRSTRERHAPVRYNPAVFFCNHVTLAPQQRSQQRPKVHAAEQFTRPVTNHSSAFAFTVALLLMFSFCSPTSCAVIQEPQTYQITAGQELSKTLGSAKLCLKNNHGQLVEIGKPPDCNIMYHQANVKNVFVTPYFRKLLSEHFMLYSCTVEIEQTWTYMNFVGGRTITQHSISYRPLNEIECRQHAELIKLKQTKLIPIGPFTYINVTHPKLTYTWCCYDVLNVHYKLIVKVLVAAYNYQNKKLFSPSVYLQNCEPLRLYCQIDTQCIVWSNEVYNSCSLVQGRNVRAQQREQEIVSTEGQFAVTLTGKSETLCNFKLQTTHEGAFILVTNDPNQPFHNLSQTLQIAYQTSNLFLTVAYVSQHLQDIIHTRFLENWLTICNLQRANYYQIKHLAAGNQAIIAMRSLLQTDNIVADIKGDVIQITSCLSIDKYYWRKDSACYNHIPISFEINNHTINGFLSNNNLREIIYHSIPIPCDRITESYYKINNNSYLRWRGNDFENAATLTVTHLDVAIAFKNTDDFHLYYDKVFDENKALVAQLMDLEGISTKIKAMTDLLTIMTTNTDVSLEQIKNIAAELGTETKHIISTTANNIKSWLPSTHKIFIMFIIIIIVLSILTIIAILIKCRRPQIKIDLKNESQQNEQHNTSNRSALLLEHSTAASLAGESTTVNTENESLPARPIISAKAKTAQAVMRFRELLDKADE